MWAAVQAQPCLIVFLSSSCLSSLASRWTRPRGGWMLRSGSSFPALLPHLNPLPRGSRPFPNLQLP